MENTSNNNAVSPDEYYESTLEAINGGWRWYLWCFFGGRTYARNNNEYHSVNMFFATLIIMALVAGLVYIIPFKLVTVWLFFFFTLGFLIMWVTYANQSAIGGYILILFGTLGVYFDWHWGLSIFGYSFEPYWFALNIIIGVLAQLRRYWNALIWKLLDKASEGI